MIVKILGSAQDDIRAGSRFYNRTSTTLGKYFRKQIYTDIRNLAVTGGVHERQFGRFRALSSRFPFAIYYQIQDGAVLVQAVLDCRKNPDAIASHLDS